MTEPYAHDLLNPRNWQQARGYANGVLAAGRMIFLGGHIGWNGQHEFVTDDFVGQVEQCLFNILDVLDEANAGPEHLVRLTWYITDKKMYLSRLGEIGEVYRNCFGRNFPAMAMVQVVALMEDRALVEIEATAVLPD